MSLAADARCREMCGSCETALAGGRRIASRDYVTGTRFDVVVCPSCGLGWTTPVPADLDPYYPRTYRRYNPWVAAVLQSLYRWRVGRWCHGFATPGRALELGCGDGVMLDTLRSRGWQVCGTERTEAMAATARERYGISMYVDPDGPRPGQDRFELVVLFQVLEHLADPVASLIRARSLLGDDGRIVVGVPNLASWQAEFGGGDWFHLDVPRHLVHFTPAALAAAALRAGLRVESVRYASPEHDPFGWVQTILNRCAGNSNRLTLLLMGAERWRASDIPMVLMVMLLGPLALVLAAVSWACGRGAVMEATLVRA
jgi:SAM-dependent methyltransferase